MCLYPRGTTEFISIDFPRTTETFYLTWLTGEPPNPSWFSPHCCTHRGCARCSLGRRFPCKSEIKGQLSFCFDLPGLLSSVSQKDIPCSVPGAADALDRWQGQRADDKGIGVGTVNSGDRGAYQVDLSTC